MSSATRCENETEQQELWYKQFSPVQQKSLSFAD